MMTLTGSTALAAMSSTSIQLPSGNTVSLNTRCGHGFSQSCFSASIALFARITLMESASRTSSKCRTGHFGGEPITRWF